MCLYELNGLYSKVNCKYTVCHFPYKIPTLPPNDVLGYVTEKKICYCNEAVNEREFPV